MSRCSSPKIPIADLQRASVIPIRREPDRIDATTQRADREFLIEWLPRIVQVIDHAFEDRILPPEAAEDFAAMRRHAGLARDALRRNGK